MSPKRSDGRVYVLGSTNIDLVMRAPHFPAPGETVLGGPFLQAQGGKGANQAVAAARAGSEVRFVSCIGRDAYGDAALEALSSDGVNTAYVCRDDALSTGVALITVDDRGENCIVVSSGANAAVRPDHVNAENLEGCDVFVAQLETPIETVCHGLRLARKMNIPTILDPAPACPLDDNSLSAVSCLTPNASETEILVGIRPDDPDACRVASERLRARGVNTVILTLGERGATLYDGEGHLHQAPFPVESVDATGAGDAFTGALAAQVARGVSFRHALPFASAAGALAATWEGAQPSLPGEADILSLIQAPH